MRYSVQFFSDSWFPEFFLKNVFSRWISPISFFHMLVVGRVGRELASKHDDVGLLNEAKQQEASFCSLMMLLCAQLVLLCFATNGLILEAAVRRQPLFPNMYFPTRGVEKVGLIDLFCLLCWNQIPWRTTFRVLTHFECITLEGTWT